MRNRLTEHVAHPCLIGPAHRGAVGPTHTASAATHRSVTATADRPRFAGHTVGDGAAGERRWGCGATTPLAERLEVVGLAMGGIWEFGLRGRLGGGLVGVVGGGQG